MAEYRGKKHYRKVHPKIFVFSHTKKAEIEYFQDFKNYLKTPLLMPEKHICGTPQELLEKVINWKRDNICKEDGDQVWCVFDIDDFYNSDKDAFMAAVRNALKNNVGIAYANECFELWILMHFQRPTTALGRGKDIEKRIQQAFEKHKLGEFVKNQRVFDVLHQHQSQAVKNANNILPNYDSIDWEKKMSKKGNPSTSIHFLVDDINKLYYESEDNKKP